MKPVKLTALALALSLALTGCAGSETYRLFLPEETKEIVSMKENGQEQAVELLRLEAQAHQGENVILSPLSIETALAMAANGSQGEAREALEKLFGMDVKTMNGLFSACLEGEDDTLSIANSLWVNESMEGDISQSFRDTLAENYAAQAGSFRALDAASAGRINSWVRDRTRGKIDAIVDQSALSPDLLSILLNAVYFNGKWTKPFEKYQVSDGFFRAPEGEQEAKLMSQRLKTYFENDWATGFAKDYEDGYEFVGILPKEAGAVDPEAMDLEGFLDSRTGAYDVDIQIPKFELRYESTLNDTLAAMGLESLFGEGSLNGMLTPEAVDDGVNAGVSDVIHKTYMKMYEEGTEAAAVTGIMVATTAMPVARQVKEVFLDRPFAFLILEKETGQVVFCGVINSVK